MEGMRLMVKGWESECGLISGRVRHARGLRKKSRVER